MPEPVEPAEERDIIFPMAVWYGGGKARAPMQSRLDAESREEWRRDLERIRAHGFNTVRTWVAWGECEPEPGEWRFDNLRLLCELAEEVGLGVFLQVYAESTPMWLGDRYPDAVFVAQSGERIQSQAAPGLCTDHAGVQEAMLAFYRETAKVVAGLPNFVGWDLWSEPHIVNWTIIRHVPHVQFCFCEHTQRRFRAWLESKYEDLETLTEAWGQPFTAWEQAHAPRFGTILTCTDFLDWKMFIYEKMMLDLQRRAEAVREIDPDHLLTSHAAVPSGMTSPLSEWGGYGATDDFLMERAVDRYGLSLYPKHSFPERHWERWKIDFGLHLAHSANRHSGGFVVGELQAGPGARGVITGDPVTARDLRLWMGNALARGAKAINVYAWHPMSSGYEAGGYGLLNLDGTDTDRAREAGRIAAAVTKHAEIFASSQPVRAEVAIVYNPLAQLAGGEQASGSHLTHPDSLVGYQRTLTAHRIPSTFIHLLDLQSEDLSEFKLIILPHPILLTEPAAQGLRRFVGEGGHLFAEARPGWCDESGSLTDGIPGQGLSEVFGARESWVKTRERVTLTLAATDHPVLKSLRAGKNIGGAHFAEALEPTAGREVEELAHHEDGSPAMVASKFGEGQAVLCGTFLGLAQRHWPEGLRERLIVNLTEWAGVTRPFTTSASAQVDVLLHTSPGGHLVYLLNHGEEVESVSVHVRTGESTLDFTELISGDAGEAERCPGGLAVERQLSPGEFEVLAIGDLGR